MGTFLARGTTRMSRGIHGLSDRRYRHGRDETPRPPLVKAWEAMLHLCTTMRGKYSYLYRGRNIRVCRAWRSFENFKQWALLNGYRPGLYLARKNKFWGYSPGNCFWDSFKRRVPVRCVETGEKFPTLLAASRKYDGSMTALRKALRTGGRCWGLHWQRLSLNPDLRRAKPPRPDKRFSHASA